MGFLKRAAERSAERLWATVPPLEPEEQRVDYAHMVIALDTGDRPGTAYLTTERLMWQLPDGRTLTYRLADCDGFAVLDDRPGQSGLRAVFPVPGQAGPFAVVLYPQQSTNANRTLAAGFVQAAARQLLRHHPGWQRP